MTSGPTFLDLDADRDREQFAVFTCGVPGEPWTYVPQNLVRIHLAEALEAQDYADGIGAFTDDGLDGVAVWRYLPSRPATWHLSVLAVSRKVQIERRGLGTQLLTAVIGRASKNGIRTLTADVDSRNERMLRLVDTMHGKWERDPAEYWNRLCTIPVR